MVKHILAIAAFMVVSFGVQGMSHFVINVEHFANIGFLRPNPIIPMGLAAMVIEGFVMSVALQRLIPEGATVRHGLAVSAAFGLFLASYIVLAEPAKYAVPSIPSWLAIETFASFVQFSVFGLLLGLIHRKKDATA